MGAFWVCLGAEGVQQDGLCFVLLGGGRGSLARGECVAAAAWAYCAPRGGCELEDVIEPLVYVLGVWTAGRGKNQLAKDATYSGWLLALCEWCWLHRRE